MQGDHVASHEKYGIFLMFKKLFGLDHQLINLIVACVRAYSFFYPVLSFEDIFAVILFLVQIGWDNRGVMMKATYAFIICKTSLQGRMLRYMMALNYIRPILKGMI